ncbi:MAG: zinc-binding dehydrogenase [Hyphomicrobiales bacterium]|nr:zinc-binding dehydrogenase [Hyphomicrobiales bacterium]
MPSGWVKVRVKSASINHHDLWSLRGGRAMQQRGGAGLTEEDLPRILGTDAAGVTPDGREVLIYPVIMAASQSAAAPPRFLGSLSGRFEGTFAEFVTVPESNLVPKPAQLDFDQAACLPTAWLTAYRMIFEKAGLPSDGSMLVQGASGGLSTALIMLGKAAGFRVYATGRSEYTRRYALEIGADAVFEPGARLPERVDAVMDSVGRATWQHSLKCLRHGGTLVVPGGTSGYTAEVDIAALFTRDLRIVGSAMGSVEQLRELVEFCVRNAIRPPIDRVLDLGEAREGFKALEKGELNGKVVLRS